MTLALIFMQVLSLHVGRGNSVRLLSSSEMQRKSALTLAVLPVIAFTHTDTRAHTPPCTHNI